MYSLEVSLQYLVMENHIPLVPVLESVLKVVLTLRDVALRIMVVSDG